MAELLGLLNNPFIAEFWTWNNQSSAEKAKRVLGWSLTHADFLTEIGKLMD